MVWLLTFRVPPNCTVHVASRTFPLYPGSTSIACSLLKEAVDFARANNLECIFAYSSQWKSRRCENFGKWKWELNPYVCSFYDLRRFSQQIYYLSAVFTCDACVHACLLCMAWLVFCAFRLWLMICIYCRNCSCITNVRAQIHMYVRMYIHTVCGDCKCIRTYISNYAH